MIRYAAYGSNLHPIRLSERLPDARLLGSGFAGGWSLHFHKRSPDGSGKCTIAAHGDGVYFAVYELETAAKHTLDAIEGVGQGYENTTVEIPEFGECHTYVGADTHLRDPLAPYDWYRELVLLGCHKMIFPKEYTDAVAAVPVLRDANATRSRRQWQLVERLRADTGERCGRRHFTATEGTSDSTKGPG